MNLRWIIVITIVIWDGVLILADFVTTFWSLSYLYYLKESMHPVFRGYQTQPFVFVGLYCPNSTCGSAQVFCKIISPLLPNVIHRILEEAQRRQQPKNCYKINENAEPNPNNSYDIIKSIIRVLK